MAYLGSTQLSSVANPPVLLVSAVGAGPDARIAGSTGLFAANTYGQSSTNATGRQGLGAGQQLWIYTTTDMTSAPWDTAGYFTDAGALGMRPGDVVMIVAHGSCVPTSYYLRLNVVGSVSTGGTAILTTAALITCTS